MIYRSTTLITMTDDRLPKSICLREFRELLVGEFLGKDLIRLDEEVRELRFADETISYALSSCLVEEKR